MNKVRPTDIVIKKCLICFTIDDLMPFQYELIDLMETITNLEYAQFALKKHVCKQCVINATAAYYFYEQCHFSYRNINEDGKSLSNENSQRDNKTSNAEKLPDEKANFFAKKKSSKGLNAKMLATPKCYVNIEINKLVEEQVKKKLQGIKEESSSMSQNCQLRRKRATETKTKVATKNRPMKLRSCRARNLKNSSPICIKTDKTNNLYRKRVEGHCNSRKFECAVCHKKFKFKSTLILHKATHKKQKPFGCKICESRFYLKLNLKCHEKNHREPYECKCGRLFNLKAFSLRHQKKCAAAKSTA